MFPGSKSSVKNVEFKMADSWRPVERETILSRSLPNPGIIDEKKTRVYLHFFFFAFVLYYSFYILFLYIFNIFIIFVIL